MVEIIAEIGVNHNGSLKTAFDMIDVAKAAGADIVKFQLFSADKLVHKTAPLAEYQAKNMGKQQTQHAMLKNLELTYEDHLKLSDYCKLRDIEYLSTAFDEDSLEFLQGVIQQRRFKIPSGEITNGPFIAKHAEISRPLILSTGMATLSEVETALSIINYVFKDHKVEPTSLKSILSENISENEQNKLKELVTLLHCSTEYPTPIESVNLQSMQTLGNAFNLNYGYSDHTEGVAVAVAATALGANIIEKHFTLDKNAEGPDHLASLDPEELALLITSVRTAEKSMGSRVKRPSFSELETAKVARKSLVAATKIIKGELITTDKLSTLRPGTGLSPVFYWDVIGSQATQDYEKGEFINASIR
ncbi:N-acetylneuraminate synthase [Amylibacter sp.]|nr:N-acetylneuraminate synthase [Amylibacter sp.]MDB9785471.1 N-acetylneuraminate synthase [Amylibacter sp.]